MHLQAFGVEAPQLAQEEPAVEDGVDVTPLPLTGVIGEAQPDPAVERIHLAEANVHGRCSFQHRLVTPIKLGGGCCKLVRSVVPHAGAPIGLGYHPATTPEPVLRDLSLTLPVGEPVLVAGRSGSGKSTLLELISGLADPSRRHDPLAGPAGDGPPARAG